MLEQTKATLPPLKKDETEQQHELAVLIGRFPSQFKPCFVNLYSLRLPKKLPITIPSVLVKQRPDIQSSSALLHEASANIGVATANLLPQITLNADYGWVNNMLRHFFRKQNSIWSYGADITQPLSEGGSLFAERGAAIAAFHESLEQYHETVLMPLRKLPTRFVQFYMTQKNIISSMLLKWMRSDH